MLSRIGLIAFLCYTGFMPKLEGYRLDFDLVRERETGPTLNAVCYVPGVGARNLYNRYFTVGEYGWVYILDVDGHSMDDSLQLPNGGSEYNLSGVSGYRYDTGTRDVLVIAVGYKRDSTATGAKWKGAIWYSTDRGDSWTRVIEDHLPAEVKHEYAPVPFLDVHVVNRRHAWVSCGNGYVMKSTDGGVSWSLRPSSPGPNKPVRPNYMGWFQGIHAPDENTAWVCSDQSGFVVDKNYLK